RFGGTVVVNWHCRSLAPERLWGAFYRNLLKDIESDDRVWFTTAAQAVDWFRWRRSIQFASENRFRGGTIRASAQRPGVPPAVVRISRPRGSADHGVEENRFDGGEAVKLNFES